MSRINFLPPWVETNLQPAFYDVESGTCLQQTSRMYAKVNQLVRTVNEFTEAFNELRDYVDEYFDNLDVQEEINNKLDDMAKDGSLMAIIAPYVDSKFEPYQESINNQVSVLTDKVNATVDGSPAGVYSTVSALTTADPDHNRVYLVTADGKWYFYNTSNSTWTAGGTYQSMTVGENAVGVANLDSSLTTYPNIQVLEPTFTTPAYIRWYNNNYFGTLNTDANNHAQMSEEITLKANQVIQVEAKGYNRNVAIISVVETIDGDDVYFIKVRDKSNNTEVYTWRANCDCKVVVSTLTNGYGGKVIIYDDFVKYNDLTFNLPEQPEHHNLIIDNDIKIPSGINSSSYTLENGDANYPYVLDIDISYGGANADDGHGWGYYCLRDIALPSVSANKITIAVDIKSKDANTFAQLGCLPNGNGSFNYSRDLFANSIIINDLSTTYKRYYLTIDFASQTTLTKLQIGIISPKTAYSFSGGYKIRYMGFVLNAGIGQLCTHELTDSDKNYLISKYNGEELFSGFNKFGVIGDSLASGEAVSNAGGVTTYVDNYDYSWGQFIAKEHGMECINFSKGGLTTRSWLTSEYGLAKLLADGNKCNAYIISLGVNDANNLGAGYLGSSSDINVEDPTQNADTYYGNYGKIISAIKALQPKAKIFLTTIPETASQYKDFNTAVRTIATIFTDTYVIDLASNANIDKFKLGFVASQRRAGHYNSIGYKYIGETIYKLLGNYMYLNNSDFNQIEFIGTDYSYLS